MATIRLQDDEHGDETLPPLCMKCGAAATLRVRKKFSWSPSWVPILILAGLLPYVIVALILTKARTLNVPLCQRHRHHWVWRTAAILGSLAGLVLLYVGLYATVAALDEGRGGGNELFGAVCIGTFICGFAWLVFAALVQNSAIRASEITEYDIFLTNVSPDFAKAVRARRDAEGANERNRPRGQAAAPGA